MLGCKIQSDKTTLQQQLNQEEEKAQEVVSHIADLINKEAIDSLYRLDFTNSNTLYYIFDEKGLVYWSDNWLAANMLRLEGYNKWYYQKFSNAHTICRWTSVGNYSVVSVIPVKYAYAIENKWLKNEFTKPFEINREYDIVPVLTDERLALYSPDDDYLFSIKKPSKETEQNAKQQSTIQSFSYQNLFGTDDDNEEIKRLRRSWYITFGVFIIGILLILIYAISNIIKYKGFRNLPLALKIFFSFSIISIAAIIYIGVLVTNIVSNKYIEGQQQMLYDKCKYMQESLKTKVAYMASISYKQADDLNAELKELATTYKTDIHIYDLKGNLVSTTFPDIFESGLHSKRIAPQIIFQRYNDKNYQFDEPHIQYEHIGEMKYLAGYIDCVNWDDIQIGYICIPYYISETTMQESLYDLMTNTMPLFILILGLTALFSILLAHALTRPISELSHRLRNLDPSKKNTQIEYNNADEIGDLVESYNAMVNDLNQNVIILTEKEREAAWQTMARQVAHEIKNPLTPMKLTVQQMQRAKTKGGEQFSAYFDKSTKSLIDQIDTLSIIAGSFSAFAKNLPDEIKLDEIDIAEKLHNAVMMFANYPNISLRYIGPESGTMVYADVEQISRVFSNILQNAVQALEKQENGDIIVMLKQDQQWVEISISDNGPGIPEELRDKIFLPNFTTKTTGMGLGLAMCKNIVGRSGGNMWFESTPGKGTTFFIQLRACN
ncbi:MAG: HAMP domain-containing histidine kinase [Paludibacteraceae bacterium]|nr:HAMP domain-containing histidine kinase [Paludibacteraceae bacterium]